MHTVAQDLLTLLRQRLPIRIDLLAFASGHETPVWATDDGVLVAALSLASFDSPDATSPRDIREQEVSFGQLSRYPEARWRAYLEGHLRALPAIVKQHDEQGTDPFAGDLFAYLAVLDDPTLHTADDFAAALSDPAGLVAWNQADSFPPRVVREFCRGDLARAAAGPG